MLKYKKILNNKKVFKFKKENIVFYYLINMLDYLKQTLIHSTIHGLKRGSKSESI